MVGCEHVRNGPGILAGVGSVQGDLIPSQCPVHGVAKTDGPVRTSVGVPSDVVGGSGLPSLGIHAGVSVTQPPVGGGEVHVLAEKASIIDFHDVDPVPCVVKPTPKRVVPSVVDDDVSVVGVTHGAERMSSPVDRMHGPDERTSSGYFGSDVWPMEVVVGVRAYRTGGERGPAGGRIRYDARTDAIQTRVAVVRVEKGVRIHAHGEPLLRDRHMVFVVIGRRVEMPLEIVEVEKAEVDVVIPIPCQQHGRRCRRASVVPVVEWNVVVIGREKMVGGYGGKGLPLDELFPLSPGFEEFSRTGIHVFHGKRVEIGFEFGGGLDDSPIRINGNSVALGFAPELEPKVERRSQAIDSVEMQIPRSELFPGNRKGGQALQVERRKSIAVCRNGRSIVTGRNQHRRVKACSVLGRRCVLPYGRAVAWKRVLTDSENEGVSGDPPLRVAVWDDRSLDDISPKGLGVTHCDLLNIRKGNLVLGLGNRCRKFDGVEVGCDNCARKGFDWRNELLSLVSGRGSLKERGRIYDCAVANDGLRGKTHESRQDHHTGKNKQAFHCTPPIGKLETLTLDYGIIAKMDRPLQAKSEGKMGVSKETGI